MDFINHDILKVFEELDPLGMMGEDAGMHHVRVGNHDVTGHADGLTGGSRGVAIVGIGLDIHAQRLHKAV